MSTDMLQDRYILAEHQYLEALHRQNRALIEAKAAVFVRLKEDTSTNRLALEVASRALGHATRDLADARRLRDEAYSEYEKALDSEWRPGERFRASSIGKHGG